MENVMKNFEKEGVMKVTNIRVYDLEESMMASTYPKALRPIDMNYVDESAEEEGDFVRIASYLGKAKPGSGHDCYLKGIVVNFDLMLPEYLWRQLNRYHHIDFVSSQSKMHKIVELDIDDICNKYVSKDSIDNLNVWIGLYNNFEYLSTHRPWLTLRDGTRIAYTKENLYNMIIANTPSGIMLTARMTTNYLQLKSIVGQRQNHKMQEWRYFCEWVHTLPFFDQLTGLE